MKMLGGGGGAGMPDMVSELLCRFSKESRLTKSQSALQNMMGGMGGMGGAGGGMPDMVRSPSWHRYGSD